MGKQPAKVQQVNLDELPDFDEGLVNSLPDFNPSVQAEPVKKKSLASPQGSALPSTGKVTPSSSVASTPEDEDVSGIDDLWNTFKGAGVKALAGLASAPEFARQAALDMFMSATNMKSGFNKLPSADKKQINDALKQLTQAGTSMGGTATSGTAPMADLSEKATEYLNKKSEKIYQKTRQERVNVVDELNNFRKNPNSESVKKILYEGFKTAVESAPYMAIGMTTGLTNLGITAASQKRYEDLKESGGEVGIGNLLNSAIYGASEAVFEGTTNKILKKAASTAIGSKAASKAVAEGFVKSVLKDFGEEGASEGATTLIQELSDKITKGEDIDFWKIGKDVANSAILGGLSGGGISLTGKSAGAVRKFVANKIMNADDRKKIESNINQIQDLNLEHGEDVNPQVNKAITSKIDALVKENEDIVAKNEAVAENLSPNQIKEVIDIDTQLEDNFDTAKAIAEDDTKSEDFKKTMLDDLLKKQNELKQQKDAIQKQTTGEISIQSEARSGGEVAQGISEPKPQGATEESAREVQEKIVSTSKDILGGILTESGIPDTNTDAVFKLWFDSGRTLTPDQVQSALKTDEQTATDLSEKINSQLNETFKPKQYPIEKTPTKAEQISLPLEETKFIEKAAQVIPDSPFERALSYFVRGGKVSREGLKSFVGDSKGEFAAKKTILPSGKNKSGKTIDGIAHDLWVEYNGETEGEGALTSQDFREAVEKVLGSHNTMTDMSRELLRLKGQLAKSSKTETAEQVSQRIQEEEDAARQLGLTREEWLANMEEIMANKNMEERALDAEQEFGVLEGTPSGVDISAEENISPQAEADIEAEIKMSKQQEVEQGIKKTKKGPSVSKIMGEKPTMVTVNEKTALKERLRDLAKAANQGAKSATKASNEIRKEVTSILASMVKGGKISVPVQKALIKGLGANIANPKILDRFLNRMDKMFSNAEYADKASKANTVRNGIKKASKRKDLQVTMANLAKDFAKIDFDLVDIDKYNELALKLYNAIRPGKGRTISDISEVSDFTSQSLEAQDKKQKDFYLDQYQYLADLGIIDDTMSLNDIRNLVHSVESGDTSMPEAELSKTKENAIKMFDHMASFAQEILDTGTDPFTGQDAGLDATSESVLKEFLSMDLDMLTPTEIYRASEALNNFLVNGTIDNMGAIAVKYNSKVKAAKDASSGMKAKSLGQGSKSTLASQIWAIQIKTIPMMLRTVFVNEDVIDRFQRNSGLKEIEIESNKSDKKVADTIEKYVSRYKKLKPNGLDFQHPENRYERGLFAFLSRNINTKDKSVQGAYFNDRKNLIDLSIKEMKMSESKDVKEQVKYYEKAYDKIKDAKNIDEVRKSIDIINQDAVHFWISEFKDFYPELRQNMAAYRNILIEDDINYTPDQWMKIVQNESEPAERGAFPVSYNILSTKIAGSLLKNQRITKLPKNRVLDLDFDSRVTNSFDELKKDNATMIPEMKYRAYITSDAIKKIFPNAEERAIIVSRLNKYVEAKRGINTEIISKTSKQFNRFLGGLSRFGAAKALGGIATIPKQTLTAWMNTLTNTIDNPSAFGKGWATMFDKDAINWLNNTNRSITKRGLASTTDIDTGDKLIRKAISGPIGKIWDALSIPETFYLNNFLLKADKLGARPSWMAYYIYKLDKMGIDTSNIDWSTHKEVKEAGDYADNMIDTEQNVSDPEMAGKYQTTQQTPIVIARAMVTPYMGFRFNLTDKIYTNINILTSGLADNETMFKAYKSLMATIVEAAVFTAISIGTGYLIKQLVYSLMHEAPPEEDDEYLKKYKQNLAKEMITMLLPAPGLGDQAFIELANLGLEELQKEEDEEDQFLLPNFKNQSAWEELIARAGKPGAAVKTASDIALTYKKAFGPVYEDSYGNEIELNREQRKDMQLAFLMKLTTARNFLPADVNRVSDQLIRATEKNAR